MVNWDAVGAISEALGAVAVVVSLVYLAQQVKRANAQAEGSAHADWFTGWNDAIKGWTSDTVTVQAMQRGLSGLADLSKVDQAIFAQQLAALINHWHLAVDLADRHLLDDTVRAGATEIVLSVCSTPGGRAFLESSFTGFPRGAELLDLVQSGRGALPPFTVVAPWWSLESTKSPADGGIP